MTVGFLVGIRIGPRSFVRSGREVVPFVEYRDAPAKLYALHPAVTSGDGGGPPTRIDLDPFLFGLGDLVDVGGHLRPTLEAKEANAGLG